MTTDFHPDVTAKAYELIRTGAERFGSFWNHRTPTSKALGYGAWEDVPEDVRKCVNNIGRNARMRKKQKPKAAQKQSGPKAIPPPIRPMNNRFVVTDETLQNIWEGRLFVPKTATTPQIKLIREYITLRAGLNPKTCLLGLVSRME